MSEARAGDRRVRLFVAFEPPDDLRAGLAQWQLRELGDRGLRPTPAPQLHFTAFFLGSRDELEIPRIVSAMGAEGPAPLVRLRAQPVARPRKGRPRLLALEDELEGLGESVRELRGALSREGVELEREGPFWPHMTVARVRSVQGRPQRLKRLPAGLPDELTQSFGCVRMTLYRSISGPSGSEYVPLAQNELSARR